MAVLKRMVVVRCFVIPLLTPQLIKQRQQRHINVAVSMGTSLMLTQRPVV